MRCLLKSCPKCRGDLVLDGDELRCWQCGQYYYPKPALLEMPEDAPVPDLVPQDASGPDLLTGDAARVEPRRGPLARRAPRNVNSRIFARDLSDQRWWLKNGEIIRYLDQGLSVREISQLVDRGERQVRVIRERLNDLRATRAVEEPVGAGAH